MALLLPLIVLSLFSRILTHDRKSPKLFEYTPIIDETKFNFDCSKLTDCSSCIQAYTLGCGWCADLTGGNVQAGTCFRVEGGVVNDEDCPTGPITYHDPHLFGDQCCYQFSSGCEECLNGHGYCQYCKDFRPKGLEISDNEDQKAMGICYHAKNAESVDEQCAVPIDRTACCSVHSHECSKCLEESVCSYCYYTEECIYSSTGSSIPEGWCMGGENGDQSGIVKHCCEGNTCSDCYKNVVATDHSWNPNSPPCVWCAELGEIVVEEEEVDGKWESIIKTTGKCVPPLDEACPATSIVNNEEVQQQKVLLGREYCNDPCYIGGTDCKSCVKQSPESGSCVWVTDVEFPSIQIETLIPAEKEFCVSGTMSGPTESRLYFPDYQALESMEYKGKYYFSTCSITGDVLMGIIIGVCCFIAIAIIVTIITISKVRQHRLKKLVRKAEKQADAEIGEMIDIRDPNALFKLWQEEVSWEDEFENTLSGGETTDGLPKRTIEVKNEDESSTESSQGSSAAMLS